MAQHGDFLEFYNPVFVQKRQRNKYNMLIVRFTGAGLTGYNYTALGLHIFSCFQSLCQAKYLMDVAI